MEEITIYRLRCWVPIYILYTLNTHVSAIAIHLKHRWTTWTRHNIFAKANTNIGSYEASMRKQTERNHKFIVRIINHFEDQFDFSCMRSVSSNILFRFIDLFGCKNSALQHQRSRRATRRAVATWHIIFGHIHHSDVCVSLIYISPLPPTYI